MLQDLSIVPDGDTLTHEMVSEAARNPGIRVRITDEIRDRVVASQGACWTSSSAAGRVIYGVTTSVGGFVNWLVPPHMIEDVQNNIIRNVQSQVGPDLDEQYVRRRDAGADQFARPAATRPSRWGTSRNTVAMYNNGVVPCIPRKRLARHPVAILVSLACIALVATGHWRARFRG